MLEQLRHAHLANSIPNQTKSRHFLRFLPGRYRRTQDPFHELIFVGTIGIVLRGIRRRGRLAGIPCAPVRPQSETSLGQKPVVSIVFDEVSYEVRLHAHVALPRGPSRVFQPEHGGGKERHFPLLQTRAQVFLDRVLSRRQSPHLSVEQISVVNCPPRIAARLSVKPTHNPVIAMRPLQAPAWQGQCRYHLRRSW